MDFKNIKVVKNSAERTTITIDGIIGGDYWWKDKEEGNVLTTEDLRKELRKISDIKTSIIDVVILSPGGDVHTALVIHDMLKELNATINTKIYGLSASAATIIHQAGNTRLISKYAMALVHKASAFVWGNANAFQQAVDDMNAVDETIKQIYIDNGVPAEKVEELFAVADGNGRWQKSSEFIENGFADGYIQDAEDNDKALKNIDKKMFQNLKISMPENLPTAQNSSFNEFVQNPIQFIQNIIKTNPMNEKLKKVADIIAAADVKNENGTVSLAATNFEKLLDAIEKAKVEKTTAENNLATKTSEMQNTISQKETALQNEITVHTTTKNSLTEKETALQNEITAHTTTKNSLTEKENKVTELQNLIDGKGKPSSPNNSDSKENIDWEGCPHMQEED